MNIANELQNLYNNTKNVLDLYNQKLIEQDIEPINNLYQMGDRIEESANSYGKLIDGTIEKVNLINLLEIRPYTFYGCDKLTSTDVTGELIKKIGEYAFYNCHSLEDDNVLRFAQLIGDYAFYNCYNLDIQDWWKGLVYYIGDYAFYNCKKINDIVIQCEDTSVREDWLYVGDHSFSECDNLKKINFWGRVSYFGDYAFKNCRDLKVFILRQTGEIPNIGHNPFDITPLETSVSAEDKGYIYVPKSMIQTYQNTNGWSSYNFRAIEDYPEICGYI